MSNSLSNNTVKTYVDGNSKVYVNPGVANNVPSHKSAPDFGPGNVKPVIGRGYKDPNGKFWVC